MAEHVNRRLSKNNLPSFLRSRKGWGELFELKRLEFPHLHQIEPTNACPYNCMMCPRGKYMKRKVGYMDMEVFCKVMDEVSTYPEEVRKKEIEIFHFGESLLHPQIAEMNAYAVSKGLNTTLSVNAPELKKELTEKLIGGHPGKLIISLDGYDAESYSKIRGRLIDYEEAIENILILKNLIDEYKAPTKLVVRMISMAVNAHKTQDFVRFWKNKGIEAEIREFFPWGEPEMEELGEFSKYPPFMPCPFAWQYVVVQWNGDVVACCRDYNGENVMGNVKKTSLAEIWNGKAYNSFRENMISGDYQNQICGPCMELYYNEG